MGFIRSRRMLSRRFVRQELCRTFETIERKRTKKRRGVLVQLRARDRRPLVTLSDLFGHFVHVVHAVQLENRRQNDRIG